MKSGEVNGVRWTATDSFVVVVAPESGGAFRPCDIPAVIAALTAATAAESDVPRWRKPEGAVEFVGRLPNQPCDIWADSNGVWLVWADGTCNYYRDGEGNPATHSPLAIAHALRDAKRAEKEKCEEGPRFPKPEGADVFLGRVDEATGLLRDVWSTKAGGVILSWDPREWPEQHSQEFKTEHLAMNSLSWASQVRALLDAHLAKAKAERVVVGWRVKDSEGDYLVPDSRCGYLWHFKSEGPPAPTDRKSAASVCRVARDGDPKDKMRIRLFRVTKRNPDGQAQRR